MTIDSNEKKIHELLLETLSFYEAMSLEKIIMDIDTERAKDIENFNKETMESALLYLKGQKLIKLIMADDQKNWIKIFKRKRSWLQRLWPFHF